MAILVVATHTSLFSFIRSQQLYDIVFTALSVKVPFFFVASGFLVWNKIWDSSETDKLLRIRGWINKTLRLYLIWTLIYLPFTIYGFYSEGVGFSKALTIFLRNVFFVGENYYSWQLWYLLGMLVASVIIYIMIRLKMRIRTMFWLAGFLAISGVVINYLYLNNCCPTICDVYFKLFKTTRNGFFQGFPYIMIGVSIAQYGVINSMKVLWGVLVVSFVAHMLGYEIATFVMTYALFSIVVQYDLPHRNDGVYKSFRLTSTIIYLVHMLFVGMFSILLPVNNTTILFLLVIVASFTFSFIAISYKDNRVIKFLFR